MEQDKPVDSTPEKEVVFMIADIDENIKKNDNKYYPNRILYKEELPNIQLISKIIQLTRKYFTLNIDDFDLHNDIVSRLNYDVLDIFEYLSDPIRNSCNNIH
jgi:23S rRNA maturation-related 3'-5' exoribonuclease YhaM